MHLCTIQFSMLFSFIHSFFVVLHFLSFFIVVNLNFFRSVGHCKQWTHFAIQFDKTLCVCVCVSVCFFLSFLTHLLLLCSPKHDSLILFIRFLICLHCISINTLICWFIIFFSFLYTFSKLKCKRIKCRMYGQTNSTIGICVCWFGFSLLNVY